MSENNEALNNEHVTDSEVKSENKGMVVMACPKCGGDMYLVKGDIECSKCGQKASFSWF